MRTNKKAALAGTGTASNTTFNSANNTASILDFVSNLSISVSDNGGAVQDATPEIDRNKRAAALPNLRSRDDLPAKHHAHIDHLLADGAASLHNQSEVKSEKVPLVGKQLQLELDSAEVAAAAAHAEGLASTPAAAPAPSPAPTDAAAGHAEGSVGTDCDDLDYAIGERDAALVHSALRHVGKDGKPTFNAADRSTRNNVGNAQVRCGAVDEKPYRERSATAGEKGGYADDDGCISKLHELAHNAKSNFPAILSDAKAAGWVWDEAAAKNELAEDFATPCILEAVEYALDGFLSAGVTYIAGGHGIGKTSLLVPLASIVAGELPAWEQDITAFLTRRVIYITEDPAQAKRVRYGLKKHNGLVEQGNFRIVQAKRRTAEAVDALVTVLIKMHTVIGPNGYPVKPLILFDTTNACFEVENENDAAEVGRIMSVLKVAGAGAPVWIVGHLAKAIARDDIKAMTGRGSGAWEADAQCTAFIFAEDEATNVRYMATKKRRFEPTYVEVKFNTQTDHEVVTSPWGEEQRIGFRFGIPERTNPADRREAAANLRLDKDCNTVMSFMRDRGEVLSKRAIELECGVPHKRARAALNELLNRKLITDGHDYTAGNNAVRHDGYAIDSYSCCKLLKSTLAE